MSEKTSLFQCSKINFRKSFQVLARLFKGFQTLTYLFLRSSGRIFLKKVLVISQRERDDVIKMACGIQEIIVYIFPGKLKHCSNGSP